MDPLTTILLLFWVKKNPSYHYFYRHCVKLLVFYAFSFVIHGPVLHALVCTWYNNCSAIIDDETFGEDAVENTSNLKVKCWNYIVKTSYTMV